MIQDRKKDIKTICRTNGNFLNDEIIVCEKLVSCNLNGNHS